MGRSHHELSRKTVTFIVTKECNFRCRYCYEVRKHGGGRMPFEVAKDTIDYLVGNPQLFSDEWVVWEFAGGEALLEIDLIDKIIDYALTRTYERGHPWFENSLYSLSTNGSLYHDPQFQRMLDAHGSKFEVGLTIDGPAHVHDRERVFPNGEGTHAQVVKNVAAWLDRYPKGSTKVTISHDTLPFIAESMLYLFSLGIKTVHSNVVFENVWQPGDAEIFEEQLNILCDHLITQDLWQDHECSFFSRWAGNPLPRENDTNWCGAGRYMMAVDDKGVFYPCIRFADFSLANQPPWVIGDTKRGILPEKLEPLMHLTRSGQSEQECMDCEVASGCAWCQGLNYDTCGAFNHRATFICQMHKARSRANKRFWGKVDTLLRVQRRP